MTYLDLVNLLPDWAWLLLAGVCVVVALGGFAYGLLGIAAAGIPEPRESMPVRPYDWAEWDEETAA